MTKKRNPKPWRPISFKVGDVVCLREYGAPMTVEECDGEHVCCVWFGIDRFSRWTGSYRRRFRRGEIELCRVYPVNTPDWKSEHARAGTVSCRS